MLVYCRLRIDITVPDVLWPKELSFNASCLFVLSHASSRHVPWTCKSILQSTWFSLLIVPFACTPAAGDKQLAILCHVPKALQEATPEFSIKEWVAAVVEAAKASIVEEGDEIVKATVAADPSKELFPLKLRDSAQQAGFAYIKGKGLIPDNDDDDDDYVLDPEAAGVEW